MNAIHKDTVLVVDDSPETLAMINDTLEKSGLTCLVSIDPLQGLNIAKMMQPDLILLDGLMPNMSGFDFCKTCKNTVELCDIPIIFMTGLSDSENIVQAFESGGVDYVTKPIDNASLIARIRVHLANAKIIRSTQLALDKAGQHVFAVNAGGEPLWQTPDVSQYLDKINTQEPNTASGENWADSVFWPAIKHWITESTSAIPNNLSLHHNNLTITLEALNNSYLVGDAHKTPTQETKAGSEILIRLRASNQQDNCQVLRDNFKLSAREADVLFWISKGKTNREIGHILGISPRTINKHLEQIFKKLEVDNRTNAAAKAIPVLRDL